MFYTYILQSYKDGNFYTGSTNDLRRRLQEHNAGRISATKKRIPLKLVYYEACIDESDARKRETYLKTSWGEALYQKPFEKLSNGVNSGG